MAARRERIEPSFDHQERVSEDELSISPDDRAVPSAANDRKRADIGLTQLLQRLLNEEEGVCKGFVGIIR